MTLEEVKITIDPSNGTTDRSVAAVTNLENGSSHGNESTKKIQSTIQTDTGSNDIPLKEGNTQPINLDKTVDNPYVVQSERRVQLRIPQKERFAPKPWGKIKHVIIGSYLSMLCCCVCGMCANSLAFEGKRYKDLGMRSEAKVLVTSAVRCIYAGIIIGSILTLVFGIAILVAYLKGNV